LLSELFLTSMQPANTIRNTIAFRWLSYGITVAFLYYWLFTISLVFFEKQTHAVSHGQAVFYTSFLRQGWGLFAVTRPYNRELKLVIRDKSAPVKSDTIVLTKYIHAQKIKHAPFNNYQEALENLLTSWMRGLEKQVQRKKALLQKQFPAGSDTFYLRQGSSLVEQDRQDTLSLQNIISYTRYVLEKSNISAQGKEFQIIQSNRCILPFTPANNIPGCTADEIIFISTFKNL
jgi:hypothetical protein